MKNLNLSTLALASALLAQATVAQTLPPPPVSPTPITRYEYDAQGNRTKIIRGAGTLNLETRLSYDPLSRVKEHTDAKNGKTGFEYDGGDRTTKVTDPRSLVTQYPRNGFGDATQLISPDTGTANHTYDTDGRLLTRTDSRGVLETYTYDGLGRLTTLVYSQSGQPSQTVSWSYDLKGPDYSYSADRLSRTDHPNGSSRFKYDPQGRVIEAVQAVYAAAGSNSATLVSTTRYGYTLGRLMSITYPSGRKLVLSYTNDLLTGLSLAPDANGSAAALLTNIQWEPFGPASSWNWAMASGAVAHERFYDLSGRIVRLRLGDVFRDITYDAADRIVSFTHLSASDGIPQPSLDQSFGYDENDRITSITTVSSSWAITYDANGNRTSVTLNGSPSVYTTEATSNRLSSITNPQRSFGYDNAGNTTTDSPNYTASYGLSGSLASITRAGITGTYNYDANKRRIRKVTSAGAGSTIIFVHDQDGHLLGEYDQSGQAIREYVWLGDTPVAMVLPDPTAPTGAPQVFYIHTDHLDTPRIVVDPQGHKRWRWLAEPFGTTAPETNPEGLGAFTQNLRFPGQYADQESGLFYNYFRSYDSTSGRYTFSDPIGLAGGTNTYAYVGGNPLQGIDPTGLFLDTTGAYTGASVVGAATGTSAVVAGAAVGTAAAVGVGLGIGFNEAWEHFTGQGPGGSLYDWVHPDPSGGTAPAPTSAPVVAPAPGLPAGVPADPKGDHHAAYHRICDQPPPPGLDKCAFMRWKIQQLRQCIAARKLWDSQWGMIHGSQIKQKMKELKIWERRLENAWDCKKDCP